MEGFKEKANFKHKEKCKRFIAEHKKDFNNHATYSKALKLALKLAKSMMRSQRFFNWKVKSEFEYINSLDSEIAKEIAIMRFNNKQIVLFLDEDGHKVFDDLNRIIENNSSYRVKNSN